MHLKSKNYFGHLLHQCTGGTLISIFLLKNPTATCVAVGSFIYHKHNALLASYHPFPQ